MNLFIDTNVFLSFFHFTSDDLEELRKLAVLLQEKRLVLWLPSQVIDEFVRNRDSKIKESLKRLRDQRLNLQFPQICKDYPEYQVLRSLQKEYETQHAGLLSQIEQHVARQELKADEIVRELFDLATPIECDDQIVDWARRRSELGNPPGKPGSIGDGVNWEALLSKVPDQEDCSFVGDDGDYSSALDDASLNAFLLAEWARRKNSVLHFYRRLSAFFADHFPDITLASELERELLVRNLPASDNFATTHRLIAKLGDVSDFTSSEVMELAVAATTNNQIRWILDDADVRKFFRGLLDRYADVIDDDSRTALETRLGNTTDGNTEAV